MDQLKELGWAKRWSSQPYVSCCTTSLQELTTLGIKHVENLAIPSVRNDASLVWFFLATSSLCYSGLLLWIDKNNLFALQDKCIRLRSQDWGLLVPYLIGSISLIVLAIGSISPGYVFVVSANKPVKVWKSRHQTIQMSDIF
ncbi:uncharacterized protein [Oryza sativa Japonica Group]|uniref:uncharacterized protein isoform X1 n=1 Tax=Oryza sativa subsp. japonica TaxID=39947 RepID=UPI00339C42B4